MHFDPAALDRTLDHLRDADHLAVGLEATLQDAVVSVEQVFGVAGAGLMFVDDTEVMRYVASSDEPGRVLEIAQEEVGIGPCVDSLVHDTIVRCTDVATDERYRPIAPIVVPRGVRAVLGLPLHIGGTAVGTLNVYRDEPHEWTDDDVAALTSITELIEAIIGGAVLARRSSAVVEQLERALKNRVTIERAVGVLMGRDRIDAVTAFNQLRARARAERRKVVDLATELLATNTDPTPT
jgi:GAF domain-containing protein